MKVTVTVLCVLSALGIAVASTAARSADIRHARVTQLRAIARSCGMPVSSLKLSGMDFVHVRAPAHPRYRQLNCVFTALSRAGFRTQTGYVGNETFDPKAR